MVTTTTDSQSHARSLAAGILQQALAACVQILPIESHYMWQGRQEQAEEWLLQIKTRMALYGDLERFIQAHHPYQLPQVICLPVLAGQADYLQWIREQAGAPPSAR